SAEFGSQMLPGGFMKAEFTIPMTATSAPGQRPAIVVVSTMAGMKKMKVTRDWVIGKISQCSAAASAPTTAAKTKRRTPDLSIHGHNRANRISVFSRAIRRGPQGIVVPARLLLPSADGPPSGHGWWQPPVLRQILVDPGPIRCLRR